MTPLSVFLQEKFTKENGPSAELTGSADPTVQLQPQTLESYPSTPEHIPNTESDHQSSGSAIKSGKQASNPIPQDIVSEMEAMRNEINRLQLRIMELESQLKEKDAIISKISQQTPL